MCIAIGNNVLFLHDAWNVVAGELRNFW
jgi:hypothetical protein